MPSFRAAPVRVRVPASSANLGPAFDSAGLALALYDDVIVRVADSGLSVDVAGEGADDLPRDKRHLVVKALRAAFTKLGGQPRGLEVVCANRIPQSRGLGSSSAAIVAAIVAARALVLGGEEMLDDAAALALANDLEGHPDNVAACLHGGLTFAWQGTGGLRVHRLATHPSLLPVAFIPSSRASTKKARSLLPDTIPFADAASNSGRAALLSLALTSSPHLLLDATEDRLHQDFRAEAMPRTAALVKALREDGIPAVVSGAGPTVLALTTTATAETVAGRQPRAWDVVTLPVDTDGASVLPLG
ncbi:MAG: serine kinase [Frankiales bacterium]|nr:serine kinase [Frankiales bacterium]